LPDQDYGITSKITDCSCTCEESDLMVRNLYRFRQIGTPSGENREGIDYSLACF
jgi:hypothetical protein